MNSGGVTPMYCAASPKKEDDFSALVYCITRSMEIEPIVMGYTCAFNITSPPWKLNRALELEIDGSNCE